jgi:hypothetical protein
MKQNKFKLRSGISHVHLHYVVRIGISEMKSNINYFAGQRQAKVAY